MYFWLLIRKCPLPEYYIKKNILFEQISGYQKNIQMQPCTTEICPKKCDINVWYLNEKCPQVSGIDGAV